MDNIIVRGKCEICKDTRYRYGNSPRIICFICETIFWNNNSDTINDIILNKNNVWHYKSIGTHRLIEVNDLYKAYLKDMEEVVERILLNDS